MKRKASYSHVIWDWNGTLFNDVGWCVRVMDKMLAERNIRTLDNIEHYHRVFCFPIIDYYKNAGFDFTAQSFEELAEEFISHYHAEKSGGCKLHDNTEHVLKNLHDNKITQVILSASEINNLLLQISEFDISCYFDEILGLSDVYAKSKIDIGLDYISRKNVSNALLIGDTEHDLEVANALGVDCLLISNGHQSKEKLLSLKVPVADDILQVTEYIC